jgi:hypothetical protein
MPKRLLVFHDVVLIVALIGIGGYTAIHVARLIGSLSSVQPDAQLPGNYRIGDVLPGLPGIDFSAAPVTVMAVIRSGCRYCAESMPLYRELIAAYGIRGQAAFVAVCLDSLEVCRQYLRRHRVDMAAIAVDSRTSLQVTGTPTLILADRFARVTGVWLGVPPRRTAARIRSEVERLALAGSASAVQ